MKTWRRADEVGSVKDVVLTFEHRSVMIRLLEALI
jgi:sporulation protein YlmC with PRC-barrel domain